ncbi:uncharacterized protein SPPG_01100 [Spizellomyces punctatus DAOM BR117]|uniref:Uncharacterized protein n=1 Tax=Spizellomyces punctatus (strain DAOM BR117) TaxID=645134 RepID=A0A0L0HRZ6_SPIPD|nr:uncharacterized protein SPPG_01100 [Spizellomyces punctatus DAOM BR117]KND03624.1 hypothetical protein SPPG_01100 [Spizellomyces punctatus DAOM BR117]|eukprot:XP_016611663.1 hypothetical protein SPPG_01100 [Spizellomyces punctatus DAOM BR117]
MEGDRFVSDNEGTNSVRLDDSESPSTQYIDNVNEQLQAERVSESLHITMVENDSKVIPSQIETKVDTSFAGTISVASVRRSSSDEEAGESAPTSKRSSRVGRIAQEEGSIYIPTPSRQSATITILPTDRRTESGISMVPQDAESLAKPSASENDLTTSTSTDLGFLENTASIPQTPSTRGRTPHQSFLPVPISRRQGTAITDSSNIPSRLMTGFKAEGQPKAPQMADIFDSSATDKKEVTTTGKRGSFARAKAKVKKGRAMTVLTKKGLSFEVREDQDPLPGNDLEAVLASKTNPWRQEQYCDPVPALPALDRRPIPSWFRTRFPAEPLALRSPDDIFSSYSQPLPITRACSAPPLAPSRRHRLLRELRTQREMCLQEAYLGPTAVNAKVFLRHIAAVQYETQLEAPDSQPLTPTFNVMHPSHQTYSFLGKVHWQDTDEKLPRCHSPQYNRDKKQLRPEQSARHHRHTPAENLPRTSKPVIPHQARRVTRSAHPAGRGSHLHLVNYVPSQLQTKARMSVK